MTNTMKRSVVVLALALVACAGEDLSVGDLPAGAGAAGVGRPPPLVAGKAGSGEAGQAGSLAGQAGTTAGAGQAGAGAGGEPVQAGQGGQAGQEVAGQAQAGQAQAGAPAGSGGAGEGGAGEGGQEEAGKDSGGQAGQVGGAGSPAGQAGSMSGQAGQSAGQAGVGGGTGGAGTAGVAGQAQAGQSGAAGQGPVCTFDERRCEGTQPQACQGDGQWSANGGDCSYGCTGAMAQCVCEAPTGRFIKSSHIYLFDGGTQGYMPEVVDTVTKLAWTNGTMTQGASWTTAHDFCQVSGARLPSRVEVRAIQLGQYPQTVCSDNWPDPFIAQPLRLWTVDDSSQVAGARWTIDTTTAEEALAALGDTASFRCVRDPF